MRFFAFFFFAFEKNYFFKTLQMFFTKIKNYEPKLFLKKDFSHFYSEKYNVHNMMRKYTENNEQNYSTQLCQELCINKNYKKFFKFLGKFPDENFQRCFFEAIMNERKEFVEYLHEDDYRHTTLGMMCLAFVGDIENFEKYSLLYPREGKNLAWELCVNIAALGKHMNIMQYCIFNPHSPPKFSGLVDHHNISIIMDVFKRRIIGPGYLKKENEEFVKKHIEEYFRKKAYEE